MAEFIAGEKIEAGEMVHVGADGRLYGPSPIAAILRERVAIDEASVGLYAKLAASFWGRGEDTLTAKLRAAGLMDCFDGTADPDGWRQVADRVREGMAKSGVAAEDVAVGRVLQVWRTTEDGEVLKVHAIHLREPSRNLGMTVEFCVARIVEKAIAEAGGERTTGEPGSWRDRPPML